MPPGVTVILLSEFSSAPVGHVEGAPEEVEPEEVEPDVVEPEEVEPEEVEPDVVESEEGPEEVESEEGPNVGEPDVLLVSGTSVASEGAGDGDVKCSVSSRNRYMSYIPIATTNRRMATRIPNTFISVGE